MLRTYLKMKSNEHYSVLLNEATQGLNIKSDGIYLDATLGRAGHSKVILKNLKEGRLVGIDQDDEALFYLENLYKGLMATQNVSGALQVDQALKLCKMSYEIDSRIRSGEDFDKILASYDKLVRIADFTPKNAKNANDFDSVGELYRWLEKRGWKNKYYDGATRDVVDETIKNIQAWNQRLYTEESGIGDEITRRIEALKTAKELEDNYFITDENTQDELDKYQNDGFDQLFSDEDFNTGVDE